MKDLHDLLLVILVGMGAIGVLALFVGHFSHEKNPPAPSESDSKSNAVSTAFTIFVVIFALVILIEMFM